MQLRRRLPLVIVLLIVGVTGLFALTRLGGGGGGLPPLNTVTADRGDVSQRVVAHGTIQPRQTVLVGSQVSGIVDAIYVDFNSPVRRGQLLAQIDTSTFAAAVRSAAAQLEAGEATLELSRLQWDRAQELRQRQAITAAEYEDARTTLRQAEAQLSVYRNALERAQRELERCMIHSPTDGIVISRSVDVGQTVAASLAAPTLFEIATDLRQMYIHANVSEADVGMVSQGQSVRFQVDAYRGREWAGEVIQVRNAPLVVDNVVHYETIITVSNEERLLKPGMTAEVAIITAEARDVTRVRNTALRARLPDAIRPPDPATADGADGRVYLLLNGAITARPVRTGLSDGVYTQIVSGLDAGDTLVVGLSVRAADEGSRRSIFGGSQATF